MIFSMKKAGQVLLAVAAGFVVSFGGTQAFSASQAEGPLRNVCDAECTASCQEQFGERAVGICFDNECACYLF
ncbi:hypothetical protein JY651_18170 [Pyxidicoccus parkwayensis]|uniref:Uncharacterized protein n=1 Tax=Pyxidicoccus parkwayensis TaxID=2813578 RepID=A0ABX7P8F6_9BACT|nr:hypothetical protein [Pyxidicoccus parkwaysis]QSQ26732.1 hypothetical protein JY651_18170 [Pyxidicoccus parkwaysis]